MQSRKRRRILMQESGYGWTVCRSIAPASESPRIPPLDRYQCSGPHGTYSASSPPAQAFGGRSGWYTEILCRHGTGDVHPDWLEPPCQRFWKPTDCRCDHWAHRIRCLTVFFFFTVSHRGSISKPGRAFSTGCISVPFGTETFCRSGHEILEKIVWSPFYWQWGML